jgi:hypothetical protein
MDTTEKKLLDQCRLVRDCIYGEPECMSDLRHSTVVNYLKNINNNNNIGISNWIYGIIHTHNILGQYYKKDSSEYQNIWNSNKLYLPPKPNYNQTNSLSIINFINIHIDKIKNICQEKNKKYISRMQNKNSAETKLNLLSYCIISFLILYIISIIIVRSVRYYFY